MAFTLPTWFKWVAAATAAAAAVGAAALVVHGTQLEDPWKSTGGGASDKKTRSAKAIVIDLMQGDEGDDDWYVSTTLYEGVDEHGDEYNGFGGDTMSFSDKADAVRYARELGRDARKDDQFELVRVIATDKDKKLADRRRQARKDSEAGPAKPAKAKTKVRARPARKAAA